MTFPATKTPGYVARWPVKSDESETVWKHRSRQERAAALPSRHSFQRKRTPKFSRVTILTYRLPTHYQNSRTKFPKSMSKILETSAIQRCTEAPASRKRVASKARPGSHGTRGEARGPKQQSVWPVHKEAKLQLAAIRRRWLSVITSARERASRKERRRRRAVRPARCNAASLPPVPARPRPRRRCSYSRQ